LPQITFDDGIASAVEHGLPILEDFGAPGTMFLTVEMLGWGGRVDAAGAARLAGRGTVTHGGTVLRASVALRRRPRRARPPAPV
jgi:peptidoglycan/xylan/chitin deacetylase (PgdA/CDA1 family)